MALWEVQPPEESPASRWQRDTQSRGGDWNGAVLSAGANPTWTPNSGANAGKLVYDADGRLDREYLRRGGDQYLVEDADGNQSLALDPNGRNDREYAHPETLTSAITGGVYDDAENLQGSPLAD